MTKHPTKAEQRRAEMDEAFDAESGGKPETQQNATLAPLEPAPPAEPVAAEPADGRFFLTATAGSRAELSKAEYDALVVALADMRQAKA